MCAQSVPCTLIPYHFWHSVTRVQCCYPPVSGVVYADDGPHNCYLRQTICDFVRIESHNLINRSDLRKLTHIHICNGADRHQFIHTKMRSSSKFSQLKCFNHIQFIHLSHVDTLDTDFTLFYSEHAAEVCPLSSE